MSIDEKKKNELEWYDNPNVITNFIIGLIALIVILSQSFAINNNLSPANILGSILNHNIVYLLVFIYFVALKTKIGKKYFDFLNIFLIVLHALTSVTSLLTVFQSFGLGSLLGLAIDLLILVYLFHTLLRSSRLWKSMNLNKSPFNEITNSGYFYTILVFAIVLLAVNLVSADSFDGTILTLMDTGYTLLFIRYVFLYGEFLDVKKIAVNNEGNFDEYREMVKDGVNNFAQEYHLEEKFESVKEKVDDFADDVKEKAIDIKDDIVEKIEDAKLDEKFAEAKEKVVDFASDVKEKVIDLKEEAEEKIKQTKLDEKFNEAKDTVSDFVNEVKDEVVEIKEELDSKIKEAKIDEKLEDIKEKVVDITDNVKDKVVEMTKDTKAKETLVEKKKNSTESAKEITSRKKKVTKKSSSKKVNK